MVQSIILTYPNCSRTLFDMRAENPIKQLNIREFTNQINVLADLLIGTALLKSDCQIEIKIIPKVGEGNLQDPVFKIMDGFLSSNDKLCSIMRFLVEKRIFPEASAIEKLSPMQRKIVGLVRQGLTYKAIADKLSISPHTVNGHRKNAMKILGVTNSKELTSYLERFDKA